MQSFSSRIWTRVAVSILYDDNHYTTGTSLSLTLIPNPVRMPAKNPGKYQISMTSYENMWQKSNSSKVIFKMIILYGIDKYF